LGLDELGDFQSSKDWLASLETGTFREVEQSNVGLAVLARICEKVDRCPLAAKATVLLTPL